MVMQLSGWVLDNLKAPVNGATVNAYAATSPGMPGGGALYTTTTDANGHWAITGMTTQNYDTNIDKSGTGFWEKGLSDWNINTLVIGGTSPPAAGALQIINGSFLVSAGDVTISGGKLTFGPAVGQVVPGATSLSWRNNANNADNLLMADAGLATIRNGLIVTASGVVTGPVVVKAGNYTMVATDAGALIVQSAANTTTLPAANAVPSGQKVSIKATIAGTTIARGGGDTIWTIAAGQTSISPAIGDSYDLRSDGTSIWYVV